MVGHLELNAEPGTAPPSAGARPRRTSAKVACLSLALWVAATVACAVLSAPQHWTHTTVWPNWSAFPVLVALFAAAEVCVVHLHIRNDAHTFSLVELPLALGVFFAPPFVLIAAQLLGEGAALAIHRKQRLLKLSFNTAVFALSTVTAVALFRFLAPDTTRVTTTTLLSGAAAVITASTLSLILVYVAIALSSGTSRWAELRSGTVFGLVTTAFTTSLAIIAVIVLVAQPWLAWILVVPTGGVYLANWAYTTQRRRHEGLEFLYESTRMLHQSPELESAIIDLLRHAQETFHAAAAELICLDETGLAPMCIRIGPNARFLPVESADERDRVLTLIASLVVGHASILRCGDEFAADFLAGRGYRDAIVAPLPGEQGIVGALVIANHLSEVIGFDENDARLAETLANHTAIALENGRLEQSLEQLRVLEGRLTFQATHDPLTTLANRTLFRSSLSELLERHGGTRGAVLFIDLDDFKSVNDTLGHGAGDELLIEVAARLRCCMGASDTIARLGGDEFAVLMTEVTRREQVTEMADRIMRALAAPAEVAHQRIDIRASVGLVLAEADTDAETIMRSADTAMYYAKAQGKHQYASFEKSMHESSVRRHNLRNDLLRALERRDLYAHFQPIVSIDTNALLGAEALVRWRHPSLGLLLPSSFLNVVDETGLLPALDMLVLEDACAWMRRADVTEPERIPFVSVNISPCTFHEPQLVEHVLELLTRHGLTPDRIRFEITENLMATDARRAIQTLHDLVAAGIQLALDDFGTGYSSLSYLQQLPVSVIKIAKSFIDDVDTCAEQRAFVTAIVTLARSIGKSVVAEGIEREAQHLALSAIGCDSGQGYFYGRPMEDRAFSVWLHGRRALVPTG